MLLTRSSLRTANTACARGHTATIPIDSPAPRPSTGRPPGSAVKSPRRTSGCERLDSGELASADAAPRGLHGRTQPPGITNRSGESWEPSWEPNCLVRVGTGWDSPDDDAAKRQLERHALERAGTRWDERASFGTWRPEVRILSPRPRSPWSRACDSSRARGRRRFRADRGSHLGRCAGTHEPRPASWVPVISDLQPVRPSVAPRSCRVELQIGRRSRVPARNLR